MVQDMTLKSMHQEMKYKDACTQFMYKGESNENLKYFLSRNLLNT